MRIYATSLDSPFFWLKESKWEYIFSNIKKLERKLIINFYQDHLISHILIFDQCTIWYSLSSNLDRTKSLFFLIFVAGIYPRTLIIALIKSDIASFDVEMNYGLYSLNIRVDLYSSSLICVIGLISGKLEDLWLTLFYNYWNSSFEITPS